MCLQIIDKDEKCVEKIQINLSEMLWPETEQTVSILLSYDNSDSLNGCSTASKLLKFNI